MNLRRKLSRSEQARQHADLARLDRRAPRTNGIPPLLRYSAWRIRLTKELPVVDFLDRSDHWARISEVLTRTY